MGPVCGPRARQPQVTCAWGSGHGTDSCRTDPRFPGKLVSVPRIHPFPQPRLRDQHCQAGGRQGGLGAALDPAGWGPGLCRAPKWPPRPFKAGEGAAGRPGEPVRSIQFTHFSFVLRFK